MSNDWDKPRSPHFQSLTRRKAVGVILVVAVMVFTIVTVLTYQPTVQISFTTSVSYKTPPVPINQSPTKSGQLPTQPPVSVDIPFQVVNNSTKIVSSSQSFITLTILSPEIFKSPSSETLVYTILNSAYPTNATLTLTSSVTFPLPPSTTISLPSGTSTFSIPIQIPAHLPGQVKIELSLVVS